MQDTFVCPICGSKSLTALYPEYTGRCVTSQFAFIDGISLNNVCCDSCGFIFNATGMRAHTRDLYTPSMWKPKPQVMSFGEKVQSQQERALDIFMSLYSFASSGNILDFGAGKGDFLQCFARHFPQWQTYAIEPGAGFDTLKQRLPECTSYNVPFYEVQLPRKMDVIVVMSVLEHVENPLLGLRWIADNLEDDGVALLQHPNFAMLPGDLFCVDHISKLTVPFFKTLCARAGLKVKGENTGGVMFSLVCKKENVAPAPFNAAEQLGIAREAEKTAKNTVDCVRNALDSAASNNGAAAIFGTSPIGYMAPQLLGRKNEVACFIDENVNVQGTNQDGIPVVGPADMGNYGITDVALAISPRYWKQVEDKLAQYGIRVHSPKT